MFYVTVTYIHYRYTRGLAYICQIRWPYWLLDLYTYMLGNEESGNTFGSIQSISLHPPSLHMKECQLVMLHFLQLTWGLFSNTLAIAHISIADTILSGLWSEQVTMALAFNDIHIIYCHMDALQSTGLAQTNFTCLDYLIVQFWFHGPFLFTDCVINF